MSEALQREIAKHLSGEDREGIEKIDTRLAAAAV